MAYSAIGQALKKHRNLNSTPKDLKEWSKILPQDLSEWIDVLNIDGGKASGLLIPFSAAPAKTSLQEPRIVLTPSDDSNLYSRLYIAAIHRQDQKNEDFEFISWNNQRGAFDFGTVHDFRDPQQRRIEFAEQETCFTCHRSRTPIFQPQSWDNSVINRAVLMAFMEVQKSQSTISVEPQGYEQLLQNLQQVAAKDREARQQPVIDTDSLFDRLLSKNLDYYNSVSYHGFKFIDPLIEGAFMFDGSIRQAQSLAFAHEWLRKLPKQDDALEIAHNKKFELLNLYPDHYKNIIAYKNPRLKNFNLVANKDNTDFDLPETFVDTRNIEAVLRYNAELNKSNMKQLIPDFFKPTNASAFQADQPNWKAHFAPWVFEKAFLDSDQKFIRQEQSTAVNHVKHACLECHTNENSSPDPKYGSFDPLDEEQWRAALTENRQLVAEYENKELLCLIQKRVESSIIPMPPKDSSAEAIFNRAGFIQTLKSLAQSFAINCE